MTEEKICGRYVMKNKPILYVMISLDVEEEGLFSGKYKKRGYTLNNIVYLKKLVPIFQELKLPLTLFCTYSVFIDRTAGEILKWMMNQCKVEIGAHLHHWSTPPYDTYSEIKSPIPTDILPPDILSEKLDNLLNAGKEIKNSSITSFRMGRWDLKSSILPMLRKKGILVDSSVCPLRATLRGPDHFMAPNDPYWVRLISGEKILEVPITQIPVSINIAKIWSKIKNRLLLDKFHYIGAVSANPFWHNQYIMKIATKMHNKREGKVLSLFWHSSEMMPGGSPHIKDEIILSEFLSKIYQFCYWLKRKYEVIGVTATELIYLKNDFKEYNMKKDREW